MSDQNETVAVDRPARPSLARQIARGFINPLATLGYGFGLATLLWMHQVSELNATAAHLLARLGG